MDKPQSKTEELITKLNSYNYSVDSLQVLAWTELRNLNSDRDFLDEQRGIIKQQRLTKLEEVGYVLQLIVDLNKDQSSGWERKIEELELTKNLLQKQSRKLRDQIRYTDSLLEQAAEENAELVEKLKEKGLSEKDLRKQLKQKKLVDTEDDTVQRLKTALVNARRELDTIYRSPTPSLKDELAEKSSQIPKIIINQPQESDNRCVVESAITEEERAAIELLEKTKAIFVNARKAGSRGYTTETIARKLSDLNHYESEFNQLDKNTISDEKLIEEFERLVANARSILETRSPSPRQAIAVGNISRQRINMPALSEITKIVNNTVPTFFGTEGPDLTSEVNRFIQGCKMVERELLEDENAGLTQNVIECLKLRLLGSAYSRISGLKFGSVDALCDQMKKLYLKKKTLDQIREQIINSKQSLREAASKFGDRLLNLLNEALVAVTSEWPDENSQQIMIKDLQRLTVKSFIRGLRDQTLKSRFIGQEREELTTLLTMVEEAEELFGETYGTINTISETTTCSFCRKPGHERANCKERMNTPYCTNCGKYGHEMGPMCGKARKDAESCSFCKNRGHGFESCRKRLILLYCRVCRVNGHKENQFCQRPIQKNVPNQEQWSSRQICGGVQSEARRSNVTKQHKLPARTTPETAKQLMCYKCSQLGHFARDCTNVRNINQPFSRPPTRHPGIAQGANVQNTIDFSGNGTRPSYSQ